jgi:hypothetical protein
MEANSFIKGEPLGFALNRFVASYPRAMPSMLPELADGLPLLEGTLQRVNAAGQGNFRQLFYGSGPVKS